MYCFYDNDGSQNVLSFLLHAKFCAKYFSTISHLMILTILCSGHLKELRLKELCDEDTSKMADLETQDLAVSIGNLHGNIK